MNTGIEKNSFILYQKPTKGAENSKMLFLDLAKHLFATERHQIIASTFARADESNHFSKPIKWLKKSIPYAVSAICAFIRIQNDCSKSDAKITLFPDEKTSNVMDLDLIKLRQT